MLGIRSFCSSIPGGTSVRRGRLLALASLLAVMLGYDARVSASPVLPLHTSGRFIVDSNGTRVHLNAFNWYGAESTDYVVEGLQAQPLNSIVATIKGMGFNAVRLLWSNQMVESNPVVGNYALTANTSLDGEHALTIFDTVVNALTSAGVMVILDNHMSNAGWCCSTKDNNELWYNSDYPQANWVADWQAMAQRYQSNPMVIGVDLRNEPRSPATWGGAASTDWHAAAELGGNTVLAVNPGLLVFVEGVSYAGDLSGVANLPIQLNVPNQVVYEAHDYGFWYSGFTSYSDYVNKITPKWGYLVTGSNPQPVWIGEFGTCNNADTCVSSSTGTDLGYWFTAATSYMGEYGLDWSYWAINGTTESGNGGGFNTVEGYGVLNTSWNGSALPSLTTRLQSVMGVTPSISLIPSTTSVSVQPGAPATGSVTIVPEGGFSGTVNLSCSVSGPSGALDLPQCSVPATEAISGTAPVNVTVTDTTAGAVARNISPRMGAGRVGGVAVCGLLLLFGSMRRWRKGFRALSAIILVGCGAIGFALTACGGSNSAGGGPASSQTTAGSYMVTVTASATGISSTSAQFSFTVQ